MKIKFYEILGYLGTDVKFIAERYNVDANEVEMIAIECAENIAMDSYIQENIFNEYQGDGKKIERWFESYVIDTLLDQLNGI